ncbi:Fe3+-hydroxamate ABC transporter,periplasmic protein [Actinobacillus equuli]|nr:Fe3+-hydroxamate ABC transporter,periplasmic protein [Actinobacillus equuli]
MIAAKPDVVIISGRETELKKNPEAMVAGFNIDKQEVQKRLAGLLNVRAGLNYRQLKISAYTVYIMPILVRFPIVLQFNLWQKRFIRSYSKI